jgi:hypothetical protein
MEKVSAVTLVRSIRRMNAHIVIAANGHIYFVKSPVPDYCAGRAVMGGRIAALCGAKAVECAQVIFDEQFVNKFSGSDLPQFNGYASSIRAGTFYGTRYPANPECTPIFDLFPPSLVMRILNLLDFSIMRAVDAWIANSNPGRAIFVGQRPERKEMAYMLGFGRCFAFEATELPRSWNWYFASFADPTFWQKAVETIEVIGKVTKSDLEETARDIPTHWWRGARPSDAQIVETLLRRQSQVDQMLSDLRRKDEELPMRKCVHTIPRLRFGWAKKVSA